MNVRALADAEVDARRAAANLEFHRRGLRQQFLQSFRRVVENLRGFPQLYSLVDDEVPGHEVRNAILERFNYRIVYLVQSHDLVILAVAHTSRRPGHWHDRLDDETLPRWSLP